MFRSKKGTLATETWCRLTGSILLTNYLMSSLNLSQQYRLTASWIMCHILCGIFHPSSGGSDSIKYSQVGIHSTRFLTIMEDWGEMKIWYLPIRLFLSDARLHAVHLAYVKLTVAVSNHSKHQANAKTVNSLYQQ